MIYTFKQTVSIDLKILGARRPLLEVKTGNYSMTIMVSFFLENP